jgi:hypothetical protein
MGEAKKRREMFDAILAAQAASFDLSEIEGMPPGFRGVVSVEEMMAVRDALPADARSRLDRIMRDGPGAILVLNDDTGEVGFMLKKEAGWYVTVFLEGERAD